jgi:hypothetical protein
LKHFVRVLVWAAIFDRRPHVLLGDTGSGFII